MLNCLPTNDDPTATPVHILLSNNEGKADERFSFLVPTDDEEMLQRARSEELFAKNAERAWVAATSRR